MFSPAGEGDDRKLVVAGWIAVALSFLFLRIAFLIARDPFLDELFTVWIARKPLGDFFAALRLDSGPPLFYLLTKAVPPSVIAARVLALLLSLFALFAVTRATASQFVRLLAALFLVVFPTHIYFSSEARAYALCGAAIGIAAVFLVRWTAAPIAGFPPRHAWRGGGDLLLAVIALLIASYSHYYGLIAFSLPLVTLFASTGRPSSRQVIDAVAATLALLLLFIPGFILLERQPGSAMQWASAEESRSAGAMLLSTLQQLSFAAPYPPSILPTPPTALRVVALIASIFLLVTSLRDRIGRQYVAQIAAMVAGSAFLVALGKPAYFPARFESVLAVPFVLALALGADTLKPVVRRLVVVIVLLTGSVVWIYTLNALALRPQGDAARVADASRMLVKGQPLVVSGLSYLEVESRRNATWQPQVIAFPSSQATHPGWRALETDEVLQREADALQKRLDRFFWIGEDISPEAKVLRARFRVAPVIRAGHTMLAVVSDDRMDELEQKHQRDAAGKISGQPDVLR